VWACTHTHKHTLTTKDHRDVGFPILPQTTMWFLSPGVPWWISSSVQKKTWWYWCKIIRSRQRQGMSHVPREAPHAHSRDRHPRSRFTRGQVRCSPRDTLRCMGRMLLWIGGHGGGQRGQGALVRDNKIWVIAPNVTPLDTQAGKTQGNTSYKLREPIRGCNYQPIYFTMVTGTEATVIGGELCKDSDKSRSTIFHIL
jgi:hypothetical protein